jgi:hypothetical protein
METPLTNKSFVDRNISRFVFRRAGATTYWPPYILWFCLIGIIWEISAIFDIFLYWAIICPRYIRRPKQKPKHIHLLFW